jgi:hypothetical protein
MLSRFKNDVFTGQPVLDARGQYLNCSRTARIVQLGDPFMISPAGIAQFCHMTLVNIG